LWSWCLQSGRRPPFPPDERALVDRHLDACGLPDVPGADAPEDFRAIGHISHEPITSRTRDEVLAIFRAWRSERR
jgi:hypothetical protein